jgi:hypothetical protein
MEIAIQKEKATAPVAFPFDIANGFFCPLGCGA